MFIDYQYRKRMKVISRNFTRHTQLNAALALQYCNMLHIFTDLCLELENVILKQWLIVNKQSLKRNFGWIVSYFHQPKVDYHKRNFMGTCSNATDATTVADDTCHDSIRCRDKNQYRLLPRNQ